MRTHEDRPRSELVSGIGFRVTREQREALERMATERRVRLADVVRDAVRLYLAEPPADTRVDYSTGGARRFGAWTPVADAADDSGERDDERR